MKALYPRSGDASLDPRLFLNPAMEYRGVPFWAWNTVLGREKLLRQIDSFKAMGFGGFFMHSRSGLGTPYLGADFIKSVDDCVEYAQKLGMRAWLYDEDRWPSGAAGGFVTKDRRWRMRYLLFTPWAYGDSSATHAEPLNDGRAEAVRKGDGKLVARYEIRLKNGFLDKYRRLLDDEREKSGEIWYAYLETAEDNPWFNGQAYLDTLNPEAVRRFIEETHERYRVKFHSKFGSAIPGIFTDEPQVCRKTTLSFAEERKDVILPWTDSFESSYEETYGSDPLGTLPELVWELPNGNLSAARYNYHDHIAELFATSFSDAIASWCGINNLYLTGHMMEEPTLYSQTRALGEAMRGLRSFQLPGIDMLCDWREFTTAKQAQSVAHQNGSPGVASELYGVTGWHFDFRGHKMQGDWQAALGVTLRIPHLSWLSMKGEAKRDYPAPIGAQSPWYGEYNRVEDYFARIGAALTRGRPLVRVAVVHPIESYWLFWGSNDKTSEIRAELDDDFSSLTKWLLFGLVDFDFISESGLSNASSRTDNPTDRPPTFRVGAMDYEVVVIPPCTTIRSTTLEKLEAFAGAGGKVIFLGEKPRLVDAVPSQAPARLVELGGKVSCVAFSRKSLLSSLADYRDIELIKEDGSDSDNVFYTMRVDGEKRWLFLCHVYHPANPDIPELERSILRIKGEWAITLWNTADGSRSPIESVRHFGALGVSTAVHLSWYGHDSLLLCLEKVNDNGTSPAASNSVSEIPTFFTRDAEMMSRVESSYLLEGPVEIKLSEPNVLVLDLAEYRVENGPWMPREELLKIDDRIRTERGWPLRGADAVQPWVGKPNGEAMKVTLRFALESDFEVFDCRLAVERPGDCSIVLNGEACQNKPESWFVDEDIATIPLPPIREGRSSLEVTTTITGREGLEWMYVVGDFRVEVLGSRARLKKSLRTLDFGDWTRMGFPFYAGSMTYSFSIEGGADSAIQVAQFRNPLLAVSVDSKRVGEIAYAPYVAALGQLSPGPHSVEIVAYGNRANAFGPVHNSDDRLTWFGPDSWRSRGLKWSNEYRLRPTGILASPTILSLRP